jgi:hypothetical protein
MQAQTSGFPDRHRKAWTTPGKRRRHSPEAPAESSSGRRRSPDAIARRNTQGHTSFRSRFDDPARSRVAGRNADVSVAVGQCAAVYHRVRGNRGIRRLPYRPLAALARVQHRAQEGHHEHGSRAAAERSVRRCRTAAIRRGLGRSHHRLTRHAEAVASLLRALPRRLHRLVPGRWHASQGESEATTSTLRRLGRTTSRSCRTGHANRRQRIGHQIASSR